RGDESRIADGDLDGIAASVVTNGFQDVLHNLLRLLDARASRRFNAELKATGVHTREYFQSQSGADHEYDCSSRGNIGWNDKPSQPNHPAQTERKKAAETIEQRPIRVAVASGDSPSKQPSSQYRYKRTRKYIRANHRESNRERQRYK